jgi:superfamily II DNA or RNA helicase
MSFPSTVDSPGAVPTLRTLLTQKLGRPLVAEETAFLGKIAQIFHNFRQAGRVSPIDLGRLGFATNESRRKSFDSAYPGWWTEVPRDPLELWQYVAHDIESSGLAVPEFMRPVTDTSAVRARLNHRHHGDAVRRWTDRFEQIRTLAGLGLAEGGLPPEPLDLRLCVGGSKWALEARSRADAPWKAAPRTLLERFTRASAGLSDLNASPAVFAFLALCQDQWRHGLALQLSAENLGARQFLHRVLSHPLARAVVTGAAGTPLAFAAESLHWRITRRDGAAGDFLVALHRADGSPLPASALFLPGTPGFYLHESILYRGPPALDGNSVASAIVPAAVIESPAVLRLLRSFGARLPEEIEARFASIPLRARIECWLARDFAGQEILLLELLAVADNPPVRQSWSPDGWKEQPEENPPPPGVKTAQILSFDPAPAQAATVHLGRLGLVYNPHEKKWTRRVNRSFPEDFVAWREALPPAIEVLATGELASLLSAPVRASVAFDLIESAAHRDWFDLALALRPEDTALTPAEVALLLKARGKLVRLQGKGWRRLSVQLDGAPTAALEAAGFDVESLAEAAVAGEKHRFHALQLAQTPVADFLPERQADALRARARAIAVPRAPALPAGLRAELRPYQLEGFHFLTFLSINGLGGVLADDMGLGKTLQALAWLLWLAGRQPADAPLRALVICPKSVVGNWESETARFAPALGVMRFAPGPTKVALAAHDGRPLIVVANYTQLRLNAKFFHDRAWHAVILDEAQFIKNPGSKVAHVARELPGEHRLVLTGTPIENRLLDLWSLFAFSLPGLLGTQAAFKRQYAEDNPVALERLRARVRHFLLRRTKGQVAADLPARTEEDVIIELEGEQDRLYQAELKRARAQLLRVETPRQLDKARFSILASLMRLRQICCHPALIGSAHRAAPSAKLEELLERVEELRDEGHQVLVFSQFVTMLELIRERLVVAGIEHLLLTGQTEDRDALVAQFQAEKRHTVFLLSLKAAGFGLNLTAASYVILYDPWWNPAVEAQAIDRTHRIGQLVPVNAYRFIARGTVEEKIRALQREKAALAGAIVQEESVASVLDLDSLRQILG